jgi:hypothetical protein
MTQDKKPTLVRLFEAMSPEQQNKARQMKQQNPNMTDREIVYKILYPKRDKKLNQGEMSRISSRPRIIKWQEILKRKKHPALKRAGVGGFSKPKRTPKHPKKSHVVVVKDGKKTKTIRFGEQGASVAGKPKKDESKRMKAKRKSFKSRHRKNINRGKTSAAYWANKVKW